jgi:predicted Zn-dependent protease
MAEDYTFEINFYESLDKQNPTDGRVMEILAQLYTKVGRNEEGLSMDLRLSRERPDDPLVHYNLACSLALVGQAEEAVSTLKNSIELGYRDFKWMFNDPDLDAIRNLPSYEKLIEEIDA